jgi:hypothetical protein
MKLFLNWLGKKFSPKKAAAPANLQQAGAHLRKTGTHARPTRSKPKQAVPKRQPEFVNFDGHFDGHIEDLGPGKNVLIRNRFVREDTGTHESLKILDDSMIETNEDTGFDPYNTGNFDRSRNWEKRRQ